MSGCSSCDQVERLEDRVGAAEVPALADALLRRDRRRRSCRAACDIRQVCGDVPVEAVRLVLGQHDDLEVAGVHDVGQREVDEPVDAAERARPVWLGPRSAASAACPRRRRGRWRGPSCAAVRHDTTLVGRPHAVEARTPDYGSDHAHRRPVQGVPARGLRRSRRARRRAGPGAARARRRRRAGALLRRPPRRGGHARRTPTCRELADANAALRTLGVDLAMVGGVRRHRPGALAHLVRQHGRPPRRAAARRPARRQRAQPRADAPVEGRAARRRVRRVQSGSSGRRTRLPTPSSRSAPAMREDVLRCYPRVDPDTRARRPQRHRHRRLVAGARPRRGARSSASTRTARASSSSAGSPARRVCRYLLRAAAELPPEVQLVLLRRCAGHPGDRGRGPRRWSTSSQAHARRRRLDPRDAAARRRGRPVLTARHRLRLPVGLRAARHRQPRGDGLRDRRGRHRHRRHPGGRRRRRDRAGWSRSSRPPTAPAPRSTPTATSPTSRPR